MSFLFSSPRLIQKYCFSKKEILNITRSSYWTSVNKELKQIRSAVETFNLNKPELFTMKVESIEFNSLFTQALCYIAGLFKDNGYEIRIAGGAVRDILLGNKPKDVDFATTATPDQMKLMFERNYVKMINNRGEKHGTITARLENENFEITTLRIDVSTDGRHAEVEFTTDWKIDASRRDLTINSMFLGLDGVLYDFFNGYEDLKKRKIVFVGDPDKRIKEDYLRILRYFRFYGRIAEKADNHDPKCVDTIKENISGLEQISGERIWLEVQKIALANFSAELLRLMHKVGAYPFIGLPENPNLDELDLVVSRTKNQTINPITYIASMLHSVDQMLNFHLRCKLSSYERDLGCFIINHRNEVSTEIMVYKKMVMYTKSKPSSVVEWVIELLKYQNQSEMINEIQNWEIPKFPVSGNDLVEKGIKKGKMMGNIIDALKVTWVDSEFKLTSQELIDNHLPDVLNDLGISLDSH